MFSTYVLLKQAINKLKMSVIKVIIWSHIGLRLSIHQLS